MRFLLPSLLLSACAGTHHDEPRISTREPLTVGPLPHARHGHRAHVLESELIVFGGFSRSPEERGARQTWIQDLHSGEWRRAADLNERKAFFASVVVDGFIYAVGGSIERYDRELDRWEIIHPAGTFPQSHFAAALVGRRIITVGGYPVERSGVTAFDLDTRESAGLPVPPGFDPGDHFHFVTALGDRLHVIGGLDSETFTPTADHWVLHGDEWHAATPPPSGMWAKFAIHGTVADRFYVFTGLGEQRNDALGPMTGLCYDSGLDSWTQVAPAPLALVMSTTVSPDGRLHVLGGETLDETPLPAHPLVYDPSSDRWWPGARSSAH